MTGAPATFARGGPLLGAAFLFVAASLWGMGFIAQKESVRSLSPLWAMGVRFLMAAPLAVAFAGPRLFRAGASLREAALLGAVLFSAYWLQTAALTRTPVARVALITGLYAAFVPLLAPLFGHARPAPRHWIGALLALCGLLGLVGVVGAAEVPWNAGDLMTLAHAVLGACHVLLVGRLASRADPVALNALQLGMLLAFALPAAMLVEGLDVALPTSTTGWLAFGYLALFSTVIAFILQLAGQRHLSPSTAAVVMLLETPVGAVGALLIFDERMTAPQALGAVVLLCGVFVSLSAERAGRREDGRNGRSGIAAG